MVAIDSSFLMLENSMRFIGAPLLTAGGNDNTFLFGFVRDLLRLRRSLGIRAGVVLIARESHGARAAGALAAVEFLREMAFPLVYEPQQSILDVAWSVSRRVSRIITKDPRLFQLVADDKPDVVVPNASDGPHVMTSATVQAEIGVGPQYISTYLSLTGGSDANALTKRQAIRLIEQYGNLPDIYERVNDIRTARVRQKFCDGRGSYMARYEANTPRTVAGASAACSDDSTSDFQCDSVVRLFRSRGFHSLIRLLGPPPQPRDDTRLLKANKERYVAIVDKAGLADLKSTVLHSSVVAFDCEADGKDPHRAELLGVSFSAESGVAFFVPLIAEHLKDITPDDVVGALREILGARVKLVGHNIKYDYLLLQKHGIQIENIYFDTMLAAYDCYGDLASLSLKGLALEHLRRKTKAYGDVVGKAETLYDLPLDEVVEYGCQHADVTLSLYRVLMGELEKRNLADQYFRETLPLAIKLGDLEYSGIPVARDCLSVVRNDITTRAAEIREELCGHAGASVDIDTHKGTVQLVSGEEGAENIPARQLSHLHVLEQLAVGSAVCRLLVKYRRLRRKLRVVESVLKAVEGDKVHPVFSQVKSRCGTVSSATPALFDVEEIGECLSGEVSCFVRNRKRSLKRLCDASQDSILAHDIGCGSDGEPSVPGVPVPDDVELEEFVLLVAAGQSDGALARRYLTHRFVVSELRHDVETRYSVAFLWLAGFRKEAMRRGYFVDSDRVRYFSGLKSSDLEKRKKAADLGVRWVLQY